MSTPHPALGRPDLRVVDVNALEPCTAVEAARQITAHTGCTRGQAEQMVGRYLDEVSEQVGCSVHRWGLDPHDLAAILTGNGHQITDADDLPDPLDRAGTAVAGAEHAAAHAETAERTDVATAVEVDAGDRSDDTADGWGSR